MPESRKFSHERVVRAVRERLNPIRGLTPATLVTWIEEWRTGQLRHLAILWDELADRDTRLKGIIAKRQRSASRCPWEICVEEDTPEANRHREFLEDFYTRLQTTSVLEQDQRGGVALMLRQMMAAVGHRYSVHEIVWKPGRDGSLTADLHHAPLWFFEGRNGRLQYLPSDFAIDGQPMRDSDWLVTVGDGLMMASAIAYVAKDLAWKDWLTYSEKFGLPIIDASTSASQGTPEWDGLVEAVSTFLRDGYIVRNQGAQITMIESKGAGVMPQPAIVEHVNRELAALWRGGDLSTMSSQDGEGQGASLQGDEARDLTADDCELLTETLNHRMDVPAIRWKFGRDVRPLAYFRVRPAARLGVADEIAVDRFLSERAFPLAISDVAERYGRAVPDDDEPLLAPPPPAFGSGPGPGPGQAGPSGPGTAPGKNEEDVITEEQVRNATENRDPAIIANVAEAQRSALRDAFARDLQPLRERLQAILTIEDPEIFATRLQALRDEAPGILRDIGADPDAARELEAILGHAMLAGLTARAVPA